MQLDEMVSVCGILGCNSGTKSGEGREHGESACGVLGMVLKIEGSGRSGCELEVPLSEASSVSRSVKNDSEGRWS
jgi:hypothetical protein